MVVRRWPVSARSGWSGLGPRRGWRRGLAVRRPGAGPGPGWRRAPCAGGEVVFERGVVSLVREQAGGPQQPRVELVVVQAAERLESRCAPIVRNTSVLPCFGGILSPARFLRTPANDYRSPAHGFRTPTNGFRSPATPFRPPANGFGARANRVRTPANRIRTPANRVRSADLRSEPQTFVPKRGPSLRTTNLAALAACCRCAIARVFCGCIGSAQPGHPARCLGCARQGPLLFFFFGQALTCWRPAVSSFAMFRGKAAR